MLGDDLRWALDPVTWAHEALGFDPDPWQAAVLRSDASRMLLLCCRQSGKSTVASLVGLHSAIYRPSALVLLLSPSLRQSGELFRRVSGFYRELAKVVPSEAESALRLELQNGSRIVSLPGKEQTVRGFSGVDLLVVDEAARVLDPLYYAVRPMLAVSGGRLLVGSTPFGRRGWFYETWYESSGLWERIEVPARECPRISEKFLAEERAAMPAWFYNQEYDCTFESAEGQVFPDELIERAFTGKARPLFDEA